ncbi:hypothetical protein, partial [Magnetococcus sp. PR-3]|uniref:hypothetical protein n=1 Tax=Magnetococcus sp. PR-3 TaxID=3120355 RepID=UPI002FCE3676
MDKQKFEIKYIGVDALHVAFQGNATRKVLESLERAKLEAKQGGEDVWWEYGGVYGIVRGYGTSATKGYAYIVDTGPMG